MVRVLIVMLLTVGLLACGEVLPSEQERGVTVVPYGSIANDDNVIIVVPTQTVPAPVAFDAGGSPTSTPAPATSNTSNSASSCTPREDWPTVTVSAGDTLFSIAQTAGASVNALTTGNCLDNPDQIEVGQILRVPVVTPTTIAFALFAASDQPGTIVGCGDVAVMVETNAPRSNVLETDVRSAINALLDYPDDRAGLSSALIPLKNASIGSLFISDDLLTLEINQNFPSAGVCADARIRAQMLLTIFQFSELNRALIRFNGNNLKQQLDMSGQSVPNAEFTRSDIG